jgi:predicted Zn-dependent protease
VTRRRPVLLLLAAVGCAGEGADPPDYLRYVAYEVPGNEHVLLRWETRRMPLKVHLPPPPDGLASDPEAVLDAVRDGVVEWADVAGPGIPGFAFVEDAGDADIPIVWDAEPSGWFVAHCVYDVNWAQRRFGVARILVTTREGGREVSLEELYLTVLHEMGHALGLTGHSPDPDDAMYRTSAGARGLSERDRATVRRLYGLPIGHLVGGARSAD